MEKGKEQKLIERLPEGKLRNIKIQIEDKKSGIRKGCACCICSPETKGAGDVTATESAKFSDSVMVVVCSSDTEA